MHKIQNCHCTVLTRDGHADAANDADNARIYADMRIDLHRCAWPSLVLTLAALLLVRGPARQPHDITNNLVMCKIACHVNQNCST